MKAGLSDDILDQRVHQALRALQSGRDQEFEHHLDWMKAQSGDQTQSWVLSLQSRHYAQQGAYDRSLTAIKRAQKLWPWDFDHWYRWIQALIDHRLLNQAQTLIQNYQERSPQSAAARYLDAQRLYFEQRYDQSGQQLQILEKVPGYHRVAQHLKQIIALRQQRFHIVESADLSSNISLSDHLLVCYQSPFPEEFQFASYTKEVIRFFKQHLPWRRSEEQRIRWQILLCRGEAQKQQLLEKCFGVGAVPDDRQLASWALSVVVFDPQGGSTAVSDFRKQFRQAILSAHLGQVHKDLPDWLQKGLNQSLEQSFGMLGAQEAPWSLSTLEKAAPLIESGVCDHRLRDLLAEGGS